LAPVIVGGSPLRRGVIHRTLDPEAVSPAGRAIGYERLRICLMGCVEASPYGSLADELAVGTRHEGGLGAGPWQSLGAVPRRPATSGMLGASVSLLEGLAGDALAAGRPTGLSGTVVFGEHAARIHSPVESAMNPLSAYMATSITTEEVVRFPRSLRHDGILGASRKRLSGIRRLRGSGVLPRAASLGLGGVPRRRRGGELQRRRRLGPGHLGDRTTCASLG
jgi:hypothetical protein